MKNLHVVITRLAVNWTNHKNFKQDWDVWVSESIQFMDKFCRPSLQNQSNKDFVLLSLVDDTITEYGNMLPNEVILKIKADSGNYPKEDILKNIDKYIKSISKDYDAIIVTRLDRDDCLKYNFIETVQKHFESSTENSYVDLSKSLTHDMIRNITHDSPKYSSMISPFVSTFEKIVNDRISCISMRYDHTDVNQHLKGTKNNNLIAMQVITGKNMLNAMYGGPIKINKMEYGIK
tara:strand:+ start:65 stop:766 length:702 start_codon:yes stop_codon:yes gene_type:complete